MASSQELGFQPRFVLDTEYALYGLPSVTCNPDITGLVLLASTMIDAYCGRTDGDGSGSLVYTTYKERLMSQSIRRNIFYIPKRPLIAITQQTIDELTALDTAASGFYYTGCLPSTTTLGDGRLSSIIGASGRYTHGRRDNYASNDAYQQFLAPMALTTLSGGPASWQALDLVNLDYSEKSGEAWLATGSSILGYNYNEVILEYNSGYDPRNIPKMLKHATSAMCKNLMAKGSGTTGMKSFNSSKSGVTAEFDADIIDGNVQRMLEAFVSVRAY